MSEKELERIGSSICERGDGSHLFDSSSNPTRDILRISGCFDRMFRRAYSGVCLMAYPRKIQKKGWKTYVNDG